jgi:signal transduction histidine kinase
MQFHQLNSQGRHAAASGKPLTPGSVSSHVNGLSVTDIADVVLCVHEYERDRLGRELHDSAGQLLVSLHLSIAQLSGVEQDGAHAVLLAEMQEIIGQLDQEIRALSFLHNPAELGEGGLAA